MAPLSQNPNYVEELYRMLDDSDIRRIIVENLGNSSLVIIKYIIENNINDFKEEEIAKNLNLSNKEVREVLNRMYDEKIMVYRKEPTEHYNWFSFYWTMNIESLIDWIKINSYNKVEELKNRIESGEEIYYCPHCSNRFNLAIYSFEEASDLNFRCSKCGGELEALDHEDIIKYE